MKSPVSPNTQRWQRILKGDTHEFAGFVDENKNLITSIAYSATGDLAGSEDIAQETFLVAWQSRQEVREPEKVVGWLCSIARNLAKQWIRKRSSKSWATSNLDDRDFSQTEPHPAERLVSQEEQELVWGALETIPESYREVLVLYYRESQSLTDVALALEITEDAARQRLSRGRNLLRAEVERTVESALANTRPSVHFTASVMSLIAVSSGSTLGKAATTATATILGKSAAQSGILAAAQTASGAAATGAAIGAAGGLLGVLGGLGGTWLGTRVPQLLAPTMTERKLLEREGRIIWRRSLIHLSLTVLAVAMVFVIGPSPETIMIAVGSSLLMGLAFAVMCIVRGLRINRQIKEIRLAISPEDDPNPTWLKDRIGVSHVPSQAKWVGRRATSQTRWLGWPLYDFQVSDPTLMNKDMKGLHAKGWLAVGDRATGFMALGGIAKGFFALGGVSLGVFSAGGLSVGLVSLGGLALGLLSLGGLAIGHSAIGGGALGWQAAGGAAVGIYSANGGLAIAGTIAEGGGAISWKYAVGGGARAPEANTPLARQECRNSWMSSYMGTDAIIKNPQRFRTQVMIFSTIIPVASSVLMAVCIPTLMYRRRR